MMFDLLLFGFIGKIHRLLCEEGDIHDDDDDHRHDDNGDATPRPIKHSSWNDNHVQPNANRQIPKWLI